MPRTAFTDQQLLDYSGEHLLYELQMFHWVADNLPSTKGFELSAMLESFAVHLRNLIDFLYDKPQDAHRDDLIAADFLDPATPWDPGQITNTLDEARQRANKEINHITYKRKSGGDPTKPWPVADLFNEVNALCKKFGATASDKKLNPEVVKWLAAGPDIQGVMIKVASTSTSNTAAVSVTQNVKSGSAGAPGSNKSSTPH